jgi:carbamoylphosphate synthase small subunit
LVLQDGTTFEGYAAGHLPESGVSTGEFVFNTALSGYQEVITVTPGRSSPSPILTSATTG